MPLPRAPPPMLSPGERAHTWPFINARVKRFQPVAMVFPPSLVPFLSSVVFSFPSSPLQPSQTHARKKILVHSFVRFFNMCMWCLLSLAWLRERAMGPGRWAPPPWAAGPLLERWRCWCCEWRLCPSVCLSVWPCGEDTRGKVAAR
uniref:Uncharacterized protein n=1 Tax=Pipistrellus kuhlii TaxID=59472 RepID=A0A7J7VVG6_PIPKU|nr:hypothetical protein mPipKuh1_008298 [Pipistrellus kuhlii]